MKYFILLFLIFSVLYIITKKYSFSLFISLLLFFLVTIFNYNLSLFYILFSFLLLTVILLYNYVKKAVNKSLDLFNFIMINYMLNSIHEFFLHKHIMHCNMPSSILNYIPFIQNFSYIKYICSLHIQHHNEVQPDMNLINIKDKISLFFNWYLTIFYMFITTIIFLYISKKISTFQISFVNIVILSIILSVFYSYLWNKIHRQMHNTDVPFSILEGPYDEGLFNLSFITNTLLPNHRNHHLQKGEKKGNYNIILLGADEWFYKHNKYVNNTEYCKTHQTEEICIM